MNGRGGAAANVSGSALSEEVRESKVLLLRSVPLVSALICFASVCICVCVCERVCVSFCACVCMCGVCNV